MATAEDVGETKLGEPGVGVRQKFQHPAGVSDG